MAKPKKAPTHLRDETRKWFMRVLRDWEMADHHIRLLTLAAEAWDRCQEARGILAQEGIAIPDRFGQLRQHPAVAVERDSRIGFARLIRELRLDVDDSGEIGRPPELSGTRMKGGPKRKRDDEDEIDELENLLRESELRARGE